MIRTVDGIPTTGVEATLLLLAHLVDAETLEVACEDARRRRLTSMVALRAYLDRWQQRGRPGLVKLRHLLAELDPVHPARSKLEVLTRRLLVAHGLGGFVRELPLDAGGRRFRYDFAFRRRAGDPGGERPALARRPGRLRARPGEMERSGPPRLPAGVRDLGDRDPPPGAAGRRAPARARTGRASAPEPTSHPEAGVLHGGDGGRRAGDLDLGRGTGGRRGRGAARRADRRAARPGAPAHGGDGVRAGPRQLEAGAAEAAGEEAGRLAGVAEQRGVLVRRQGPGAEAVRPAHVLVVDEELVEVREPAHPADAEEARRRAGPDGRDQPAERPTRSSSRCRSANRPHGPGHDEPGRRDEVVLPQDQVRRQVERRPRVEQGRRVRADLIEQVAELLALDGVEQRLASRAERTDGAWTRFRRRPDSRPNRPWRGACPDVSENSPEGLKVATLRDVKFPDISSRDSGDSGQWPGAVPSSPGWRCCSGRRCSPAARSPPRSPSRARSATPGSEQAKTPGVHANTPGSLLGERAGMSPGSAILWESPVRPGPHAPGHRRQRRPLGRVDVDWNSIQNGGPTSFWWERDRPVRPRRPRPRPQDHRRRSATPPAGPAPRTARPAPTSACPASPEYFADFARAAAQRYGSRSPIADLRSSITAWQIWNEPNHYPFVQPTVDVVGYTSMLKRAYVEIKGVDPTATVLAGGTAPAPDDPSGRDMSPVTFLRSIYANGGKGFFDAFGHHPYSFPCSPLVDGELERLHADPVPARHHGAER